MDDRTLIRHAITLAGESVAGGGTPFGALLFGSGEIITGAVNEVQSTGDPTAHAELLAIREACRKLDRRELSGTVLYSSCEPCPMCMSAGYFARVDRIVYAAGRGEVVAAGFEITGLYDLLAAVEGHGPPHPLAVEQLLADEGRAPFVAWIDRRRPGTSA